MSVLKNKYIKCMVTVLLLIVTLFSYMSIYKTEVYAMDETRNYASQNQDPQVLSVLKTLSDNDIDTTTDIFTDAYRKAVFGAVKGFAFIVDSLYDGIDLLLDFMSFGYSDEIVNLANRYSVIYRIIFIVSIVFLGIYLIISKTPMNNLNTTNCIIFIIFVILAMPLFTKMMTELTVNSSKFAKSQWITNESSEFSSLSSTVIKSQVYDLYMIDGLIKDGKVHIKDGGMNYLQAGSDDYKDIDINEPLDDDNFNLKNEDVFKYERVKMTDNYELRELHHTFLPNTYYYRYQIKSWLFILVALGSAAFALSLMFLRVARMIIEIANSNIYMPFIAISDIASGQRIKEAFKGFVTLFGAIFLAIAMFGVYMAGFTYINTNILNLGLKIILLLAICWSVVDGSQVIERVIGVDIGLKSGWGFVSSMFYGMRMAHAGAKGTYELGKGMYKVGKGAYKVGKAGAKACYSAYKIGQDKINDLKGQSLSKSFNNNFDKSVGSSDNKNSNSFKEGDKKTQHSAKVSKTEKNSNALKNNIRASKNANSMGKGKVDSTKPNQSSVKDFLRTGNLNKMSMKDTNSSSLKSMGKGKSSTANTSSTIKNSNLKSNTGDKK